MSDPTPATQFKLTKNMLLRESPDVARNLIDLVMTSSDPAHHMKFLELTQKLTEKNEAAAGATVNVIFDMSGAISATTAPAPVVIEADDLRQDNEPAAPALPAPVEDGGFTDLATLLGLQDVTDIEPVLRAES